MFKHLWWLHKMAIKIPEQILQLFPFPLLTVGSRRRESQFGTASLTDLFRDPANSLNTKIWKIRSSASVEVSKGILTVDSKRGLSSESFIQVKNKHKWKGSVDGAAIWQARIKIIREKGAGGLLCEFGLIGSDDQDGMFFWADASDTTMTPEVEDDGTNQNGSAFTVVDNAWHTYKIEANASNQIKFYLDNVLKATLTDSNDIPWTKELVPYFRATDVNNTSEAIIDCNWMKMSF